MFGWRSLSRRGIKGFGRRGSERVIRELRVFLRDIFVNSIVGSYFVPSSIRWRLLRALGFDLHKSRIMSHVWIEGKGLSIGERVFINYRVLLDSGGGIEIGDRVSIGYDTRILTVTHEISRGVERAGRSSRRPVSIGEGAWIGAGVTVLPGVCIGKGCVIGAGSVVNSDCLPNGLYVGVPARRVRELQE